MEKNDRLIYANAFLKALNERPLDFLDVGGDFGYFDETIDSVMNEQPTIDAAEVVHGRWNDKQTNSIFTWHLECSVCNADYNTTVGYNYCPNCGAKMDGAQ